MILNLAAAVLAFAAQGAGQTASQAPAPAAAKPAEVRLAAPAALSSGAVAQVVDASGKAVGGVYFYEGEQGLLMRIEVSGLTPGWHGIHLHETGVCAGPKFTSAGAHINPSKTPHGLLHPQGGDNGDLPSIYAEANGIARVSLFTDSVSLNGKGGRPALLDADGSAIVIHANPDDQRTQPLGGSGDRVACGVIKAPAK